MIWQGESAKSEFTRNVIGAATVNIATAGLGLVSGILAARLLGPTGRGELAAVLNWPILLSTFGALGVMTATGYYCGRYPSDTGRTVGTAWVFLFLISFPVMALGYWLMPWLMKAQTARTIEIARFMLLLILIQFSGGLPYWALQGLGRFKIWNAMRIQMPILWVMVFLVSAYSAHPSAKFVAYGYLVVMAFHNFIWNLVMFRFVPGHYRPDFARLRELLRFGLPTVSASVPQQLNQRFDQLLMIVFLPAKTLGLYVVAVAWSVGFSPLLTAVSQVLFPRLASIHDRRRQTETLQRTFRLSVFVAGILMALLLIATPLGLPFVFGPAFASAVPAALILVVAAAVASLKQLVGEALRGLGLPKYPMIAEVMGFGIALPLLIILLPRYQLVGAAVASLAGYSVTLAVSLVLISRDTGASLGALLLPSGREILDLWHRLLSFRKTKVLMSTTKGC